MRVIQTTASKFAITESISVADASTYCHSDETWYLTQKCVLIKYLAYSLPANVISGPVFNPQPGGDLSQLRLGGGGLPRN